MVFNPTIQGGTRFDQPVSPGPSGVEVLGNILGGLGVFESIADSQRGPAAPNNEQDRFNARWNAYVQEIGQPNLSPMDAPPSVIDGFGRFDPARYDTALRLHEQSGGSGRVVEREQRDAFAEFRTGTPQGITAQVNAAELYPDNLSEQERYIARQYALHQESIAAHQDLERQSQQAGFRGNISDEAWSIELDNVRNTATNFALGLRNVGIQLANGGQINLAEQNPELAALTGYNTLTRENLSSAVQTLRAQMTAVLTSQLRGRYGPSIRPPDQAYLNQAFAPLTAVMDAVLDETNPSERLNRLQDQTHFNNLMEMSEFGRSMMDMYDRYGQNPTFRDVIATNSELLGRFTEELDGILTGRNFITTEVADNMSREEAGAALDLMLSGAQTALDSGSPTQQQYDDASGFVASLPSLLERLGGTFDTNVYEFLSSPNVQRAIEEGTFSDEARTQMSQLVMFDLEGEFDDLRGYVSQTGGALQLVDGQVVYTGVDRLTTEGQTIPPIPLNRNAQTIIDRINEKLSLMGAGADEGILGTEIEALFEGNATVEGMDVSAGLVQMPEPPAATEDNPTGMNNPVSDALTGVGQANTAAQAPNDINVNQGIIDSLSFTESRGRFEEFNLEEGSGGRGHFGRLQFSRGRLADAERVGVLPAGTTPEEFLANPMLQQRVEQWHIQDIRDRIDNEGLSQYIGQTINGVRITEEGLVAVAHLGGFEGMRRFVESGGSYNPSDAYGTTLLSYASRHGSAQPVELTQPNRGVALTENVWAREGMNPIITMEGASQMTQPYAQERMTELLNGPFQQLQQLFGGPLLINDAIARDGTSRETQTPGSRHFHGDALDIDITGMTTEEQLRLVRAAQAAGFRGFGFGQNILHIDMGAPRSWAYGNNTFAGRPVSELQDWVSTGQFPSDFGMSSGSGVDAFVDQLTGVNAAPDFDEGEGEPSDFTVYEDWEQPTAQEVEQGTGQAPTLTPEQQQAARNQQMADLGSAPIDQEVLDLITSLTQSGDETSLEELRRFLQDRVTPMDASRPRGVQ